MFFGASAKPPLRSVESGVGTGAWDAGAGVGLALSVADLLVLLDATYWSYGDLPELDARGTHRIGFGWLCDGRLERATVGRPVGTAPPSYQRVARGILERASLRSV